MKMPWDKQPKEIEELEEIEHRKSVELSIEQKQAAIRRLKQSGLTPKSFGNNWRSIWNWLRTH